MNTFLFFTLALVISVPILLLSMWLTNLLGGGIEFGPAHWVLLKALPLLLIVNAIDMLPYGGYLGFVIWWGGLMILFGLDLWEARMLVFVNWGLNLLAQLALLPLLSK